MPGGVVNVGLGGFGRRAFCENLWGSVARRPVCIWFF